MIPFPDKKYSIIYADPPWSYSDSGCSGAAAAQYATMSINELKQLPVNPAGGGIAADDCVLFMWATYPKMQEALDLIEAWGFKYKSIAFQWIKQNRSGNGYFFGLGRWTRGNTEPCLIAIKGKPKRISGSVRSIVLSPLQQHSRKPAGRARGRLLRRLRLDAHSLREHRANLRHDRARTQMVRRDRAALHQNNWRQ